MVSERLAAAVRQAVRGMWQKAIAHRRRHAQRVVPLPRYWTVDVLEPRQLLSAALDLIGVTALRDDPSFDSIDGSGGTVVVIDTGVDFTHSKLSASKIAEADFAYGNGQGTQTITDEHGTHVAGIIGARDSNIGVATGVGLIGINVFTETRSGDVGASDTDIEQALAWVLANRERYNIVAVNMSLGSGNYSSEAAARSSITYDDVKRLEDAGVTVVTAAGNSYAELRREGSAAPGVYSTLVVGAVYEENEGRVSGGGGTDFTTDADRVAYFSQRPNTDNEIFAPGAFITSTVPGGGTKDLAGTSMASPMIAGVVALMQEAALQFGGRRLSPTEVRSIMQQTGDVIVDGDDEDTSVPTTGNSYLRVNAYNAVKFIRTQFSGGDTPTGDTDPNGTLAGAVAGPTLGLDNTSPDPLAGTIGSDGTTEIGGDDVDLYRVVVAAPGDVTVTVAPTTAFQSVIRIFNTSGTSLGTFTGIGGGDHDITVALDAGTYYFGVSGAPNNSYQPNVVTGRVDGGTGDYDVSFSLDTSDADGVLTGATPINLSPGDVPQALEASVGKDGTSNVGGADVDFYKVVVPDDGTLLVDIDTPDDPNYADTYIRVFDESGNELANSDDDLATGLTGAAVEFRAGFSNPDVIDSEGNFQGHRTDSFVGGTVSRGDVYYVAVANYNNRNFQPDTFSGRVSTGSTGSYSLFVGFRNNDVNGAIPQAVQTSSLPVEFAPGVIGTDNSTVDVGDRDVDVIRVRPDADGILEIDVDSYDDDSITDKLDAVLSLFDADGNLLAKNDDADGSFDPRLRIAVTADTDYYVAVSGAGNDTFDPFQLGSGGSGDTGEYTFSARLLDASAAASLQDDTLSDAGVSNISLGDEVLGSVGDDDGFARGAADVDLYRFVAPFSGEFIFTVEPSDAFGVDPYLRVFDVGGTQIAADDNSGTTTNGNTGGARIVVTLAAGQTYVVGVNGAGANAGNYNPVTGAGAADGDTGGYILQVSSGSRIITFGGKTRATYTDADGSNVVISLKGPGTGTLLFASDAVNQNPSQVVLEGTTDRTTLYIKGDTELGVVTVNGSLKAAGNKSVDLTGDLSATGTIKSLTFRNISDSDITLNGGTVSLLADVVTDSSLSVAGGVIKSIKVNSWADTAPAEAITAGTISSVSVKGNFAVAMKADSIGKVSVGGALSGEIRSSGNIASVTVGSIGATRVLAGVAGSFSGIVDSIDDFANAGAVLKSFSVKSKLAGVFGAGALVAAPVISKASLGNVATDNGATVFGLLADSIGSASGASPVSGKFKLRRLDDPTDNFTSGDFAARLL